MPKLPGLKSHVPKSHGPDWAAVRHDYENAVGSNPSIVEAHGTSLTSLFRKAREENWRRKLSAESIAKRKPWTKRGPTAREKKIQLKSRLLLAIERKLERIEDRLAHAIEMTAADSEREARELGQLIRNFEKLTTLDDQEKAALKAQKPAASARSKGATAETNNDADRWRQELAKRIERLRRQWPADGTA